MRFFTVQKNEQILKVIETLTLAGRSEKTIKNYVHAINRFLNYLMVKILLFLMNLTL